MIASLTVGLLLSGCKPAKPPAPASSAPAAATVDVVGSYVLVSINGTALPFTVTHEGPGIRVTSGTFTFRPDATCTSVVEFVLPSGEAQRREVGATYTQDGARIAMQWQGAGMTVGTLAGDTFSMDNEGQVFLFRRTR